MCQALGDYLGKISETLHIFVGEPGAGKSVFIINLGTESKKKFQPSLS